jgi:hypothetical protein
MRRRDERRDRSPRRTRPKGRAPGLHVLVLAEACHGAIIIDEIKWRLE